jgi:hypothetical protein
VNLEAASGIEKRVLRQDLALDNQAEVAEAVVFLCEHWLGGLTGVEMRGQLGAPDWRGFELRVWQLGESLRLFLKKKKQWRGRGQLLDAIANLLSDRRFGKGRQTLALLLGDFGGRDYGDALGRALDDSEVWGHAIKALTKAKISGFAAEVAGVQAQEKGWIRSAARKYLQSFEA